MTLTHFECADCGHTVNKDPSPFCPECGVEDPWAEVPVYAFDDADLPIVFGHEFYDDNWDLWRSFASDYFGSGAVETGDVADLPDAFPNLSTVCVTVYFRITEDYEMDGPYLSRREARTDG